MIIAHVISSLNDGGAEAVLYRLCMADKENSHVVVSLRDEGKYGPLLAHAGVAIHCLGMQPGRMSWKSFLQTVRLLRRLKPDVIQTWMYHADLVGGVAGRIAGIRHVCWGSHNTNLDPDKTKPTTILVARINGWCSRWIPARIVSCSQKGVEAHLALGYAADKFVVVPNGYDLTRFTPDEQAREMLRESLGIPQDFAVFGMVARFDPQKDHGNLLAALAQLKRDGEEFICLLVGAGMVKENAQLFSWLNEFDLQGRVLLLGPRDDIPSVMNALDVHVLSSSGEAFPNVLCEAMACGTPCVSTDVGDARMIIGDTGWCVLPSSPPLLAKALSQALTEIQTSPAGWVVRQEAARRRMLKNFSIDRMVAGYNDVWKALR